MEKININGIEHDVDNLNEREQFLVAELRELAPKLQAAEESFVTLRAASVHLSQELQTSVSIKDDNEQDNNESEDSRD